MQMQPEKSIELVYPELSYTVVGLLFQTHSALGIYRNEKQYGDYFEKSLQAQGMLYVREYRFEDPQYELMNKVRCVVDFIIDNKIILEFKAKDFVTKEDYYQTKRYLIILNLHLGMLINFRQKRLAPKRVLNSQFHRK